MSRPRWEDAESDEEVSEIPCGCIYYDPHRFERDNPLSLSRFISTCQRLNLRMATSHIFFLGPSSASSCEVY